MPTQEVKVPKEFSTQLQQEQQSKVKATRHDVGDWTHHFVKPNQEGEHLLPGTFHGQYVHASPFVFPPVIRMGYFYSSLKTPVHTVTGINQPYYIAFNGSGNMFVTSYGDNCVYVYDSSGRKKATIGKYGHGNLEFDRPFGIAITGDTAYVADAYNHRVQCFTTSRKFLGKFGSFGTRQFSCPTGIRIDSDNQVYASDSNNHRVQVFSIDWSFVRSFDGNAPGKGNFKYPYGNIAPDGNLFIAGYASNNVIVLTRKGQFVRSFEVKYPTGVAVDAAGFSLVTTNTNPGPVSIFDPNGRLIHKIEGFNYPRDVQASCHGSMWITEDGGNKVSQY